MDPKDIFEYAIIGVELVGMTYLGIMGSNIFSQWPFCKKIKSQEELEDIVKIEAEELGLDHTKIESIYQGTITGSRKTLRGYELQLKGDSIDSTRKIVRHELYHILKDCDRGDPTFFYYWFVAEPRAVLYGTFGIKL